jgi:hypothetical protein
MTSSDTERADALAALRQENTPPTGAERPVERTGVEVGEGDVTRLVVSDRFPFTVADKTARNGYRYLLANRGDLVHISSGQAERGEQLGALVDPDAAGPTPSSPAASGDEADEEQLAGMNATDLVAWLNAHPDQRDRVRAVEQGRDRPRSTVMSALDQLDEHYRAQAEADAEDEELDAEEA